MNAASGTASHPNAATSTARLDDLIPLFGGGIVLAGVAILFCALINAMAFAIFDYVFGSDTPASWPSAVVVGFGVLAVVVSLVVGRWLLNLRRWIGQKSDPADLEIVRRKRRSFTVGALCLYLPVSPLLWLLFVALANSADAV
ncbi:MAG: hypothetical protein JHD02_04000 [Thermoleophilaceae bacterium]|nr:hypothetical protein [Thermoleophilaceae bacterium]